VEAESGMAMSNGEYSVYRWSGERYAPLLRFVDAKTAVEAAADLSRSPAAQAGVITRIMITDGGDHCCFDWRHGEGLVFPTKGTPDDKLFNEQTRPRGEKFSER
jgi:hypothetical protein